MDDALATFVWTRADLRCEYCRMPQRLDRARFEVDHVIPEKYGGLTVEGNLALACFFCNRYKGPNLSGIDPYTKVISQLFDPRRDRWSEHFYWSGARLQGITPNARATIAVLRMMTRHGCCSARYSLPTVTQIGWTCDKLSSSFRRG